MRSLPGAVIASLAEEHCLSTSGAQGGYVGDEGIVKGEEKAARRRPRHGGVWGVTCKPKSSGGESALDAARESAGVYYAAGLTGGDRVAGDSETKWETALKASVFIFYNLSYNLIL